MCFTNTYKNLYQKWVQRLPVREGGKDKGREEFKLVVFLTKTFPLLRANEKESGRRETDSEKLLKMKIQSII